MNTEMDEVLRELIEKAKGDVSSHESVEMMRELAALVKGDPFVWLLRQVAEERQKTFSANVNLGLMRDAWSPVVGFVRARPAMFGPCAHTVERHVLNFLGACQAAHLRMESGSIMWDTIAAHLDALGRKRK